MAPSPVFAGEEARFVDTYISQLALIEDLRAQFLQEPFNTTQEKIGSCIRQSTRFQMELNAAARQLRSFKLEPLQKDTPDMVAFAFENKANLHGRMLKACTTAVTAASEREVMAIAAEMPKIQAEMDYADKLIFNTAPLMTFALVDARPGPDGKMSRMVLTKTERDNMIKRLTTSFKNINLDTPTYITASAKLLRQFLMQEGYSYAPQ